jgi:hypothetical protein
MSNFNVNKNGNIYQNVPFKHINEKMTIRHDEAISFDISKSILFGPDINLNAWEILACYEFQQSENTKNFDWKNEGF